MAAEGGAGRPAAPAPARPLAAVANTAGARPAALPRAAPAAGPRHDHWPRTDPAWTPPVQSADWEAAVVPWTLSESRNPFPHPALRPPVRGGVGTGPGDTSSSHG